tara:strand:- start:430 stop:909 length:480 start_codon:yes stop_codon:yes gene_type:complete
MDDIDNKSVNELKKYCRDNGIKGFSNKKKRELINLINKNKEVKEIEDKVEDKKENINTFQDLYEFIQLYEENNILTWLEKAWIGKDKQESLLRLFAGLGLIDKLKPYNICKGNYNEKTITKNSTIKDVFYNEKDNLINLKDKGDSSDLTGICKEIKNIY